MIGKISRDELQEKIRHGDNFYLVEALSEAHYSKAHLPEAMNIPVDKVRELAPKFLPNKRAEIVTYCANPT